MDDLKTGIQPVLPGIEESQQPFQPVGPARHQIGRNRPEPGQAEQHVAGTGAAHENHQQQRQGDQHHRSEIRLQQHQPQEHRHHRLAGGHATQKLGNQLLLPVQVEGHVGDQHELEQFGGLEAERPQPQPAPRTAHLMAHAGDEHQDQQNQAQCQGQRHPAFPAGIGDAHRQGHRADAQHEVRQVIAEEIQARTVQPVGKGGAGAEDHQRAHQAQQRRAPDQNQVEALQPGLNQFAVETAKIGHPWSTARNPCNGSAARIPAGRTSPPPPATLAPRAPCGPSAPP